MTAEEFNKILDKGETNTVEFKSWINAKNLKEILLGICKQGKNSYYFKL